MSKREMAHEIYQLAEFINGKITNRPDAHVREKFMTRDVGVALDALNTLDEREMREARAALRVWA